MLDIIGFGLLAWEWREAIAIGRKSFEKAMVEIPTTSLDGLTPDEIRRRLGEYDNEVRSRTWLFRIGAALIILGFIGQLIGSWPTGV